MIHFLAAISLLSCTAPIGAAGVVALCGDDAGSVDAPSAMDPDAPPSEPDPSLPWPMETLVAWADCRGADGVDAKLVGGVLRIATACESEESVILAIDDGAPPWPFIKLGGLQGAEDAIQCDGDGDGLLDLFGAGGTHVLFWRDTGAGYFALPEIVLSTTQRYIRLHCASPGVVLVGSYSIGASVDRVERVAGAWTSTTLRAAEWVKNIVPYGLDFLVWDKTGPLRGVRVLGTGQAFSTDANTEWGDVLGTRIVTGTANATTGVSTISIIGEPAIAYPANTGRYHYGAFADFNFDGDPDLVITASHAFGDLSNVVGLLAPDWTRVEIDRDGVKNDNWIWLAPYVYTTEEDTKGLYRLRSPWGPP